MNQWEKDLSYSENPQFEHLWEKVYCQIFPGFLSMSRCIGDGELQRLGIDRTIVLSTGKAIYLDEKIRRKNYPDIFLEYISNHKKKSPGWIEKPLFCDFIAYLFVTAERCYLFPAIQMQIAWIRNKEKWLQQYGIKEAKNEHYITLGCPIPINVLYSAIGQTFRTAIS
jgi:hypothetical protein